MFKKWDDIKGNFAKHWEDEYPLFRNFTLYSELPGVLSELRDKNPEQMQIDVIGKSGEGRELYLVTMSNAANMQKISRHRNQRHKIVKDPCKYADNFPLKKDLAPVFINCNIHGNEITGTDGALLLIDRLQSGNEPEAKAILDNLIILINICANPDGRVQGIVGNYCGDLNRDMLTQVRPETQAIIRNIAHVWYPVSMVDLHGFFAEYNISIDACTPPHNPNYEYDLLGGRIVASAAHMAKEITENQGLPVDIPAIKVEEGWDDFGPVFTPQYFMYLGAIGHTVEVKYPDQEGIDSAMLACWGALKYAQQHKDELLSNQVEIFRRGKSGISQQQEQHFPFAYLIPARGPEQKNLPEAFLMVEHLLENGIQVRLTQTSLTYKNKTYPAGSWIIPMRQSLRGLVNTMMWQGIDLSKTCKAMYDLSSYSFPRMCGFTVVELQEEIDITAEIISRTSHATAGLPVKKMDYYIFPANTNDSVAAANFLREHGCRVFRTLQTDNSYPAGSFLIESGSTTEKVLKETTQKFYIQAAGTRRPDVELQPITYGKTAVVTDTYGPYLALREMGLPVEYVDFNKLNRGFDLEANGFEALIMASAEAGIWQDQYADFNGVGYGVHFGLNDKGRQQLADYLQAGHDYIGIGFAGAKLREMAGFTDISFAYTNSAGAGWMTNLEKFSQTTENGYCRMDFDGGHPVGFSYGRNEEVYVFGPVWYTELPVNTQVIARFCQENHFRGGFWLHPELASGQPTVVSVDNNGSKHILIGFDPAFRNYNRYTYRLLANALLSLNK